MLATLRTHRIHTDLTQNYLTIMGIACGIVGLPNVGKSTLFNALTAAEISAENYPFCTIEPNVGIVNVPDKREEKIASIVNPQKIIGATMQFVDIAGLVAGASKGEGLGNQFLANIRETDAIAQVIRCFDDDNIVHVAGKVDPVADIETINTELMLADMESIEKSLAKVQRLIKTGDKESKKKSELLTQLLDTLNAGTLLRQMPPLSDDDYLLIKEFNLLTLKPMMYIANVDEQLANSAELLKQVKTIAAEQNALVVEICASLEAEIAQLDGDEKLEFLSEIGQEEPGLNRVIRAGYDMLSLQTYFTAGEKEVRAWTVSKGATAPQAAGVIHTDFEKGFIRAEVMAYDDFVAYSGEQGCKEQGKLRLEGKEYIVADGDIMHFRFNV